MLDIQTTKQNFISRQTELDNRLTAFSDNYESWIASLPGDIIPLVLLMLDHFDYYSHSDANTMLQQLHQKLLSEECEEDNALYTYIKKTNGIISSSVDYWGEYRIQNRINKNFCTDDIDALPQQDWELIENIVIIDDCCGTGGSLDKFVENLYIKIDYLLITFQMPLKPYVNKVFVRMFFRFRIMRYGIGYAIPHFLSRE